MLQVFSNTIFLHLCFTITILLKFATCQDHSSVAFLNSSCSDNTHFQQGSEFQTNLRYLLYNLTSNSDTKKFYNFTTGDDTPNRVYGLYLCYSFVDNQLCQSCIQTAVDGILQRCPSSVEAIVWYNYCMIRYANYSIFGINDVSIHWLYIEGSAEYSRYRQQLSNSFLGLFDVATARCLLSKSAITIGFLDRRRIVLVPTVDCTPDISASDCRTCLSTGLDRLLTDIRRTGVLLQPSCQLTYTFDTDSFLSADRNKKLHIGMGVISAIAATSLIVIVFLIYRLKRKMTRRKPNGLEEIESMDSLHIEFDTIKAATYNFSEDYQLGKGGFGIVYMGTLSDGQAVAVKRLSNASGQGIKEFKTEACLAAKLQHKNLVKVYGFCLEGNEMLLVYEFLPNKSLDRFLFDAKRGAYLKWETRYKIIVGVARGLQYLHEDSSPKIIHRDLKPSNILLDGEMNPKIADFGMARLFGGDQTQGDTSKIAGTFGYMAPEYGARGRYSIKSDVFSFGIILLEIVSGSGNLFLDPTTQEEGLLKYAWRLWNEGTHLNLVDPTLGDNISRDEAERCIHVGLLCTQEDAAKRPSMASVLIMLNTHLNIELPLPKSPSNFPYEHERTSNSNGVHGIPIGDIISELSPR